MEAIGIILLTLGAIGSLFFGIILIVQAFQTSVLWGLGYLFIPFVSLIFVFTHWEQTKNPFLKSMLSMFIFLVGTLLMPAGSMPLDSNY